MPRSINFWKTPVCGHQVNGSDGHAFSATELSRNPHLEPSPHHRCISALSERVAVAALKWLRVFDGNLGWVPTPSEPIATVAGAMAEAAVEAKADAKEGPVAGGGVLAVRRDFVNRIEGVRLRGVTVDIRFLAGADGGPKSGTVAGNDDHEDEGDMYTADRGDGMRVVVVLRPPMNAPPAFKFVRKAKNKGSDEVGGTAGSDKSTRSKLNKIGRLRELYDICDRNGDGFLSRLEVRRLWGQGTVRFAYRFFDAIANAHQPGQPTLNHHDFRSSPRSFRRFARRQRLTLISNNDFARIWGFRYKSDRRTDHGTSSCLSSRRSTSTATRRLVSPNLHNMF